MQDPGRQRWSRAAWLVASLAGILMARPAAGASRLAFRADSVEVSGLVAHGVDASVQPAAGHGLVVEIHARRLEGVEPLGTVSSIIFACPRVTVSPDAISCGEGRLAAGIPGLGPQDTPFRGALGPGARWKVSLQALALAGGVGALVADGRAAEAAARLRFSGVGIGSLAAIPAIASRLPQGFTVSGTAAGLLQTSLSAGAPGHTELQASLAGLSFSDQAGQLAGEQLGAGIALTVSPGGPAGGWAVAGSLDASSGQAYLEPVFLDFGARPAHLEAEGVIAADAATVALSRWRATQPGIGEVDGTARIDLGAEPRLRHARARLHGVDLAGAWPVYGAPWAVGTQWSDLVASGRVDGEVDLEDDAPSRIALDLEGLSLDSVTGSVAVTGLGGRFAWFSDRLRDLLAPGTDSAVFKSRLAWESARLWGIEFGAASIPFTTTGAHFRLLDPVVLPVFDGGLSIDTLRLRHAGTPQMYLRFDAELTPISLGLLTRSLGWPQFGGTVSGRIPRLELADGFVTLGGNLEASVFDGRVTVRNLRLRDPLGEYPQLFADIDVDRLDLGQVTSTFEFGMITGRLSGRVEGLETFDWMPVAFDASFFSTPGDRAPRRIDQRAVSNLSSIGGGSGGSVAAAMQGGFLRFFDSFRYERLGLSCRLANDVCHMDGVAPAETGYYIVKGSGLPRIDVIGNQRRVAWTRLVRQLAAITESPGPVVD
jgi:hypothetical protein